MGSKRGWVRVWAYFTSKYKGAGTSEGCSWIHKAPWQQLAGAGGLCGTPGQELEGARYPIHPLWGFAFSVGPCAGGEWSLSIRDSPFRWCLGLWNNRWCFYNLSEACSWVDGERQYLRTTGLREVVKLLLPIYIFFDNAFTEECFLFLFF